ncbi:unnamed protein product [Clonostachys byssicola]|uniref:Uncharacterized protein n=1 Tax=Clonostachys byssicola TaxID=160290 RepID=A0A9N9UU08_9HYPO|nr:unnamed protein product [Clonostachys byssicola]
MSQPPSTPVKVPPSASSYTPATLDPDLRSQINTLLIRDGHINKKDSRDTSFLRIQDSLLHSLNSNTTNWPTLVQAHALSLLRSGEVSTYPALLARVLDDIRSDSLAGGKPTNGDSAKSSGSSSSNGNSNTSTSDKASLAVPESVIEDALRTTRESLEALCEVEDDGSS